jgi:hypothetical protein
MTIIKRTLLIACVLVSVERDTNGLIPCVRPTLEVFNSETGMTTLLVPVTQTALPAMQ